jgi:hypothetical protein
VLLALFFACTVPQRGEYALSITGAETDCTRPVAESGSWEGAYTPEAGAGAVNFFPGEACTIEGDQFSCDLGTWDQSVILSEGGDLEWQAAWSAEGSWDEGQNASGTVDLVVACTGADCAAVVAPEPCAVEWTWEAVWTSDDDSPRCLSETPAPPSKLVTAPLGLAVQDPIEVDIDRGWTPSPVVLGPAGAFTPPAYVDASAIDAGTGLFLPTDGWEEAPHRIVGAWEDPEAWSPPGGQCDDLSRGPVWLDADVPFTPAVYGQGTSFNPAPLAGTRWQVVNSPWVAGGVGAGEVPMELYVEFDDVAEGRVALRVETETCTVLEDRADLDAGGGLDWSRERIDVATEPESLVLYEPSFSFDFAEDGSIAAGGRVRALIDVRAADASIDVCNLVLGFGGACIPCPDDGVVECLDVAGLGWVLEPVGAASAGSLPWCGVDFSEGGEYDFNLDIECDTSGTHCAMSALGLWAPLALLRRRRRPSS